MQRKLYRVLFEGGVEIRYQLSGVRLTKNINHSLKAKVVGNLLSVCS